ncbi:LytTR family DNA-binding domain-containing protein [Jiulongibacter sediminis]|jgi:two-component system LytT family response regulator|uniref:LytTR family DNA-binding domain-containing protein n=1 Tax=Jiulongibacter sediminis TaxID=1605367 RepID=UPI0026F03368|nr:LytTR family DNA-binding domain-containing protein [Jiulongibacter sediminis]
MHKLRKNEPNEIIYLKADSNYTIFQFTNGEKDISGFTLKHHQEKPELKGFLRVNRAYLLNPKYIDRIIKQDSTFDIRLSDGTKTKVSRRRLQTIIPRAEKYSLFG